MKNTLLSLFVLLFLTHTYSQEKISAALISNYKTNFQQYIGTDVLGNKYFITDNELIKQVDNNIIKYKNLSLGEIYNVDLQNPLQIVIFYKKFNSVVLLDNQLNEVKKINFSNIEEPIIAEAASLASENRLWVYDITVQRIKLYNFVTNKFVNLTPPFKDNIKYYHSDYNYFYWIDIKNNYYRTNLFGKVNLLGRIPDYEKVQIISPKEILLKKDNILYHINVENQSSVPIILKEKTYDYFYYKEQILTIFTSTEISNYKIILP